MIGLFIGLYCANEKGKVISESDKGTRKGDSGGPLTCLIDGNQVLQGIAQSIAMKNPTFPYAFTKVFDYLGWINTIINRQC